MEIQFLTVILLLFPSLITSQGQNCFGGIEAFEKTTGVAFDSSVSTSPLLQQEGQALTRDCTNLCKQQSQCLSFALSYTTSSCDSYEVNSVGRRDILNQRLTVNYFEKICYRGVAKEAYDSLCGNRLWAFERVKGAYLDGYVEKELPNIQSKEECAKLCLTESTFVCRSADFDEISKLCRMSREDRRSQPQAFRFVSSSSRDYLENQCATSAPTSCRYEIRPNVASPSEDNLQYATSADDCQTLCEKEATFTCRAFTYTRNRCYLSGDDSVTLGPIPLPQKHGSTYGEKRCVIEQCTGGVFTYEKVTGYALRGAIQMTIPLAASANLGNTLICQDHCQKDGLDCPAFSVNYQSSRCYKLDRNSQGRTADLTKKDGDNYFEKICLRGSAISSCQNKAWAFERVLGYELTHYDKTLTFIQSRRDCEELCLDEKSFTCRSAVYNDDTTECKLSRSDRRTHPESYREVDNPRISYLENQCLSAVTNCQFERTEDFYPTYTDVVQTVGIVSENACQQFCTNFQIFICRSYAYYSSNGQCFISGDDKVSGLSGAVHNRPGIVYFERVCRHSVTESPLPTTQTPSTVTAASHQCQGTDKFSFEKVTGFEILGAEAQLLFRRDQNDKTAVTEECLRKCEDSESCQTIGVDNNRRECYSFRVNTVFPSPDFRPFLGRSYFEGYCLPVPRDCNKLWVFDRVPSRELRSARPREVLRGVTRIECERRCLEEKRFVCRSANYYGTLRECRMFEEDRSTTLAQLGYSIYVDYLENQCALDLTRCSYLPIQRDVYMPYVIRNVQTATSAFQCEQECSQEQTFNCRSFTYMDHGPGARGDCLLSSEGRQTEQTPALQLRPRALYAEKDCSRQGRQSSTIYPPTTVNPPFTYCTYEQFSYEKTVGYDIKVDGRQRTVTRTALGVVGECKESCQAKGDRCRGFVVHYLNFQACYHLENVAGESRSLFVKEASSSYYEKVCYKERTCGKLFTFERVMGYELMTSPEKEHSEVKSRITCEDLCLGEKSFVCRAANYYASQKLCQLFSETRRTSPAIYKKAVDESVDYLENQCAPEPSTCQYRDYTDRFLPFMDKLSRAFSLLDCQRQCDLERRFACRSVNFETITRDCALSSTDSSSSPEGQGSMQFRRLSIYSEKGTCEQVSVQCNQQDMLLSLNFGSPFSGRVYAKGNPAQCFVVGTAQNSLQFAVSLGSRCGTRQEGAGRYVNEVVIQQHPIIMTDSDKTIQVVCSFEAVDRTVTLGAPFGIGPPGVDVSHRFQPTVASVVTNTAPPPNVVMRILDRTGRDAKIVGLGDELTLRIEMRDQSAFSIFARNLYARSSNGESLFLIDSAGCPTDAAIFPSLQLDARDKHSLYADFKAFRFPSTGMVNFEVQIRFCQDQCEPVKCSHGIESFGRRRRSVDDEELNTETIQERDSDLTHNKHEDFNLEPILAPHDKFLIGDRLYHENNNTGSSEKLNAHQSSDSVSNVTTTNPDVSVSTLDSISTVPPLKDVSESSSQFSIGSTSTTSRTSIIFTPSTTRSSYVPNYQWPAFPNHHRYNAGHHPDNRQGYYQSVPVEINHSNIPLPPGGRIANIPNSGNRPANNSDTRHRVIPHHQRYDNRYPERSNNHYNPGPYWHHRNPWNVHNRYPQPYHNRNASSSNHQNGYRPWNFHQQSHQYGINRHDNSRYGNNFPQHPPHPPWNSNFHSPQQNFSSVNNTALSLPGSNDNSQNGHNHGRPNNGGHPIVNSSPVLIVNNDPSRKSNASSHRPSSESGPPIKPPNSNYFPNRWNYNRHGNGIYESPYREPHTHRQTLPPIVASTEPSVPQELPLSLAIMVGSDKPEDASWSIERIPRPAVTTTVLPEVSSCTSQTTLIATAVTVTLFHLGLGVVAFFCYRWHRKKRTMKEIEEEISFPTPPTAVNTPRPRGDVFYGSPEVTFRSIYGVYESPP